MTKKFNFNSLKKCPLHKFHTDYKPIGNDYVQCVKCGAFHKLDDRLVSANQEFYGVKIRLVKWKDLETIEYEFHD